ncbi:hypothetical protein [Bacillus cereus]|uniref:hypothetical protein n=1 Tax=Bacillus cereus TaxID=1396 RepID=UPI001F3A46CE|nr:hypothetical protein [Bacillus cereus]BCC56671.1 hypothetical protein BCJMU07_p72 [Bacillus cereus]
MAKTYSMQEMRQEKEVLQRLYDVFVKELDARLENNDGLVTMAQMNYCIDRAMSSERLEKEQKKVANSFFDTFVGAWFTSGKQMAESMAFAVTTDTVDDETRFHFL